MMYNLLVTDAAEPSSLAAVLATAFNVGRRDVDVANSLGDPDLRNWEAAVSCEYSTLRGHLAWSLEIYAQKSVTDPPSEPALAQQVATATGAVVFFPAEEDLPSAYWAATPQGHLTRARLYESNDEEPVYVVDAIESPVPQLPNVRVMRIPEVVRELRIPTPISDGFDELLRAHPLPPESAEYRVSDYLGAWERLVSHMGSGWAGSGWCPPDLYQERLEARDGLERLAPQLTDAEALAGHLRDAVRQLDHTYVRLTAEDQRGELAHLLLGTAARQRQLGWWWHRRPEPLPW
ncbi:hypothetical protein [Streptomyces justiciae]|uniref:hypothetical protein n=1 Tax=Streptomyces justiciae TaxID=2780140 RepID=UPI001880CB8D|nr:hypothetical protein [Streptomyces justiciae]MBE8478175.1 hypothetical protein [Streptomyces justiciae]MCW8375795.1 hypothetical protein [Streptomyces justiciae]